MTESRNLELEHVALCLSRTSELEVTIEVTVKDIHGALCSPTEHGHRLLQPPVSLSAGLLPWSGSAQRGPGPGAVTASGGASRLKAEVKAGPSASRCGHTWPGG